MSQYSFTFILFISSKVRLLKSKKVIILINAEINSILVHLSEGTYEELNKLNNTLNI